MPLYACRWPNGDLSVVLARNLDDAIEQLDEFANAEVAEIFVITKFLADFRLDTAGNLEMNRLGCDTITYLTARAYPLLDALYGSPEFQATEPESPEEEALLAETVEEEKQREWDIQKPAPLAETERGRIIQAHMRCPSRMANRIAREEAVELLEKFDGPKQ